MKTVLCGFYHIYLHTTRCHFTGNEQKKGGGRVILKLRGNHRHRRYGSSFCCTCHVVSSWNSNNGDYFTPISPWGWHYHLHGWASPWQINGLWARVLGSPGRKQIHFILSAAPPRPSSWLPLCPHMCEIKAIMTLHLTENAISLAKTFHLLKY